MAIRLDNIADFFSRSASAPSQATLTAMAWVYQVSRPSGLGNWFSIAGASDTDYIIAGILTSGGLNYTESNNSGSDVSDTGSVLSLATWYHLAIVRSGGNLVGYLNGVADTTQSAAAFTSTRFWLGNSQFTTNNLDGRIAGCLIYEAALTDAEIQQQMRQYAPVRTSNLWAWYPMADNTVAGCAVDYSGNGRNLTTNGTLTLEDGPPVAWKQGARRIFIPDAAGTQTISPSGIASAEAFGSHAVQPGVVALSPSGIVSAEAFGSHSVQRGAVTASPSGIASAEAFGAPVLTSGVVTVSPSGIASAEAFGSHAVTTGAVTVSPSSIASGEAFGGPIVSSGALPITPTGIASAETFGAATVTTANTVSPSGIASNEVFGNPLVSSGQLLIGPVGIVSAEAFGAPVLTPGVVNILPAGIASAGAFGTPGLVATYTVSPASIVTAEAFGQPQVNLLLAVVSPLGIASAEMFGVIALAGGGVPLALAIDDRTFDAWSIDQQSIEAGWLDNRSIDLK